MPTRLFTPLAPVNPCRTIPTLGIDATDPSIAVDDDAWIAITTSGEPATLRFSRQGDLIEAEAWGPAAARALELAPGIVGAEDDPSGFSPRGGLISRLHREHRDVRITHSRLVTAALLRAVVGQKVTGKGAKQSYRLMARALGEPAPGPRPDLLAPPQPSRLAALGYEDFHPWGNERTRAETMLEVARRARRLEEAAEMAPTDAYRRITAVRGVGPWSAGMVGLEALGDADAVPVGDFHLPNMVAWALAGEPRSDDERMLELLEPFRPHRGRVVRLLKAAGIKTPRYGPRAPLRDIREM